MQFFYDGQIRRYLVQTIRIFSNFVVKYGDGTLHRIPVAYGDADRQAASIIRQNSENKVNSVPRISIYISSLDIDRERMGDSTYVGKVNIRERDVDETGQYTRGQGKNYTVERLMPTPFKLTMKVDIWSASTEQKLQILEQILVLFNPSLEVQTTDNYIDWTSLSVLNLNSINWDSKTVPVGNDTPISVATLTVDSPIWISPPVKVKHLGVITSIITSMYNNHSIDSGGYIDGLGTPLDDDSQTLDGLLSKDTTVVSGYQIQVYNNEAVLLGKHENVIPAGVTLDIPVRQGVAFNWEDVFANYPSKYIAGSSRLYLIQPNGTEVIGTIAVNPLDTTKLTVSWDPDTLSTNTDLPSVYRNSPGTFDAIIDPTKVYPGNGMQNVVAGDRFLIIEDIGSVINNHDNVFTGWDGNGAAPSAFNGADAWKSLEGNDFIAKANDIIEWNGISWYVLFNAAQEADQLVYQTNIYSGVQYLWNGVMWAKSFEGEYKSGQWRIEL